MKTVSSEVSAGYVVLEGTPGPLRSCCDITRCLWSHLVHEVVV